MPSLLIVTVPLPASADTTLSDSPDSRPAAFARSRSTVTASASSATTGTTAAANVKLSLLSPTETFTVNVDVSPAASVTTTSKLSAPEKSVAGVYVYSPVAVTDTLPPCAVVPSPDALNVSVSPASISLAKADTSPVNARSSSVDTSIDGTLNTGASFSGDTLKSTLLVTVLTPSDTEYVIVSVPL